MTFNLLKRPQCKLGFLCVLTELVPWQKCPISSAQKWDFKCPKTKNGVHFFTPTSLQNVFHTALPVKNNLMLPGKSTDNSKCASKCRPHIHSFLTIQSMVSSTKCLWAFEPWKPIIHPACIRSGPHKVGGLRPEYTSRIQGFAELSWPSN